MKLRCRLQVLGHHAVEYFTIDNPVKVEADGFVNTTGEKRTMFWLCSCGNPLAVYDQAAYDRYQKAGT